MKNVDYIIVMKIFEYYFESEYLGLLGLPMIGCKI
jgi:hypothetical protein